MHILIFYLSKSWFFLRYKLRHMGVGEGGGGGGGRGWGGYLTGHSCVLYFSCSLSKISEVYKLCCMIINIKCAILKSQSYIVDKKKFTYFNHVWFRGNKSCHFMQIDSYEMFSLILSENVHIKTMYCLLPLCTTLKEHIRKRKTNIVAAIAPVYMCWSYTY